MSPDALAAARAVLRPLGLDCCFEPSDEPDLTDDELSITLASGEATAVYVQISNSASPGRYFIVGERHDDVFTHHPALDDLLQAVRQAGSLASRQPDFALPDGSPRNDP